MRASPTVLAAGVVIAAALGCGFADGPSAKHTKRAPGPQTPPNVQAPVSRAQDGGPRPDGRPMIPARTPDEPVVASPPFEDSGSCCVMHLPAGDFFALGVSQGDCARANGRWTTGPDCERVCCSNFDTEQVDWRARGSCVKTGAAELSVVSDGACAP